MIDYDFSSRLCALKNVFNHYEETNFLFFNFDHFGCKGCPFSLELKKEIDFLNRFSIDKKSNDFSNNIRRSNKDIILSGQLSFDDFLKKAK